MELNLHPIATKCFVTGRDFQEHERVVSYLLREAAGEVVRRDLVETADAPAFLAGNFSSVNDQIAPAAFVYCRWVVAYKPRKDDNSALNLKLTADSLFLTLATPAGTHSEALGDQSAGINTPLVQFLTLMLERKKILKLRGRTEDGERHIYEHMPSHQLFEVPVGDLNVEFFQKIQEHLGVLVGTPKPKAAPVPAAAEAAASQAGAS